VSWANHQPPYDFGPELQHALAYACAYYGDALIGFVRLAWDGSVHAFLLEPTVHPDLRRRGIGRTLVERVVAVARDRGMEWVHIFHAEQAIAAAEAGKAVISEKPMAVTLEGADNILAAVNRHGVPYTMVHNFLFSRPVLGALALVDGGEIGERLLGRGE